MSGMSIGSIPWTAMIDYTERYGLDWHTSEAFVDIIRSIDSGYIEYVVAEQKKLSNKK